MSITKKEIAEIEEILLGGLNSEKIDGYRQAVTRIEQLLVHAQLSEEENRRLENLQVECWSRTLALQPPSFLGSSALSIPVGILRKIFKFEDK